MLLRRFFLECEYSHSKLSNCYIRNKLNSLDNDCYSNVLGAYASFLWDMDEDDDDEDEDKSSSDHEQLKVFLF